MREIKLNPTYRHSDDKWPLMVSATYDAEKCAEQARRLQEQVQDGDW